MTGEDVMTRSTGYVARVQRATPPERDRYIDLLRGVAIVAVVTGHWLLASPFTRDDGTLSGLSVLAIAEWTYWFTWPFQVMPIFFVVGGYANATSWRRHADSGGTWAAWVHRRSVRLLAPTAVFVSATTVVVVSAHLAGVHRTTLEEAGWVAGVALWFLAVYVAVAALTPLTYSLHVRFGLAADIVLAVIVVAGDVARFATAAGVRWPRAPDGGRPRRRRPARDPCRRPGGVRRRDDHDVPRRPLRRTLSRRTATVADLARCVPGGAGPQGHVQPPTFASVDGASASGACETTLNVPSVSRTTAAA